MVVLLFLHTSWSQEIKSHFLLKPKITLMLNKLSVETLGDQNDQPSSSSGIMGLKFHILRVKVSLLVHKERTVAAF